MTSETHKVKSKVQALSSALSELEAQLEPLFAKSLPETLADLEPIQQAKLQTAIPYVVYDLIFMYLKTQGIDPKTHPVISELDRIRQYFEKIQNAENPPKRTTEVDKAAASRFIQHAISQAQLQKDQLHWKKTAAEDEEGESSESDSVDQKNGKKPSPTASKTLADPVAGPSSKVVPAKVTSKMLERQRYEQKIQEDDTMNEGEDSDVLEVFEEDGEDEEGEFKMDVDSNTEKATQSQKSKGKGKAKQVETPVTQAGTTTVNKRRGVPMDPFADYVKDDTTTDSTSSKKRKSPPSTELSANSSSSPSKASDSPRKRNKNKKKRGTEAS